MSAISVILIPFGSNPFSVAGTEDQVAKTAGDFVYKSGLAGLTLRIGAIHGTQTERFRIHSYLLTLERQARAERFEWNKDFDYRSILKEAS